MHNSRRCQAELGPHAIRASFRFSHPQLLIMNDIKLGDVWHVLVLVRKVLGKGIVRACIYSDLMGLAHHDCTSHHQMAVAVQRPDRWFVLSSDVMAERT